MCCFWMCCSMKCMETLISRFELCGKPFVMTSSCSPEKDRVRHPSAWRMPRISPESGINTRYSSFWPGFWTLNLFGIFHLQEICGFMAYVFGHLGGAINTETVMRLFISIMSSWQRLSPSWGLSCPDPGLMINFLQVGINFTYRAVGLF